MAEIIPLHPQCRATLNNITNPKVRRIIKGATQHTFGIGDTVEYEGPYGIERGVIIDRQNNHDGLFFQVHSSYFVRWKSANNLKLVRPGNTILRKGDNE